MRRTAALLAILLLASPPAYAGLTLCNKAAQTAKVALGRFGGKDWVSEGWWTIAPGRCAKLIQGSLDARYYYLYATDGASGTWDGDRSFCTAASGHFAIEGRGHCAARGYDRRGFYQVDTGAKLDVTKYLAD